MNESHDPVIGAALDEVQVPAYAEGFWERLETRLEAEAPPLSAHMQAGGPLHRAAPEPVERALVELAPAVTPLPTARRATHRPARLVLVAAAAVFAALVVAVQLRSGEDTLQTASPPASTPTTDAGIATTRSSTEADDSVLVWLDAIGAGDVEAALALTGPRTVAYYEALGGNMEGVVIEWGEAFGGWADVDDRTTVTVPLVEVEGDAVAAVLVSGTYQGDGPNGYRTEAFPVVQGDDGAWVVEPAAFDPDRGGRLEFTSPPPGESGLGGIAPDGFIELVSGGQGTYYFAIDDADVVAVDATEARSRVRFDPPGSLSNGTHQLLVAQVDDRTITAQAHTFTVEG